MSKVSLEDTIAAIATPPGEGGISVIRISGPEAISIGERVFACARGAIKDFESHKVHLGKIIDQEGIVIDQALATVFKEPNSYTGETVVEMSLHGGLGVTRRILDLVLSKGARPAEPGEFTKRAFLNGKIDLLQAEAVVDLIRAKSDASVKVAASQLGGNLSLKLKVLKEHLMKTYAHMEAFVDFPEEDIEVYEDQTLKDRFKSAAGEVAGLIQGFKRGLIMREGITCVIAGKPNVGKSSLFNAFLERDRALVSEYEGTTRDMLEESIEIAGIDIRLIDTAGLAIDSTHPLDLKGSQKTKDILKEAGLVLFVVDSASDLNTQDREAWQGIEGAPTIVLMNKCDQVRKVNEAELQKMTGKQTALSISAKTREGFEQLEKAISDKISDGKAFIASEQITRLRHKVALENAAESLARAKEAFDRKESLDLVTLDLKIALDQMSELLGEVYSEDLLDVIFSEFCIGK